VPRRPASLTVNPSRRPLDASGADRARWSTPVLRAASRAGLPSRSGGVLQPIERAVVNRNGARLSLRAGSAWLVTPDAPQAGYADLPPGSVLSAYVERVFLGRETLADPIEEHVVPDGSVCLLFNLGDAPRVKGAGAGHVAEAVGASTRPARLEMAGRLDQVGVRLRAVAVGAVLGVAAGEIGGRTVPLEGLWGVFASEAIARLAEAPPGPERLATLERVLVERLKKVGRPPRRPVVEAVRRIEATGGRIRVSELAVAVGLGERRLEQAFQEEVGLSPKQACRMVRLRGSLAALLDPRHPLAEIAFAAGFSDQAHLGNEVRRLTGLTPRELRHLVSDSSKTAPGATG
jgi:AraC-like DNA-binding protein